MDIDTEYDIVMTKWTAINGTAILADKYAGALAGKLPVSILKRAKGYINYIDISNEEEIARELHGTVYPVSEGGIYKALWDMSEAAAIGIEINLKHIYVKQETIEICEILDVNPYMLNGEGSLLVITDNGNRLIRELRKHGITASVIGYTTYGNDRVVVNEDDRRYLNPRVRDELLRIVQHE